VQVLTKKTIRRQEGKASRKGQLRWFTCLALQAGCVIIYSLLFPPLSLRFLAWVALVPWAVAVLASSRRSAYLFSYLAGLAFMLANLYWIVPITIPGYLSMCAFLGLYWLLSAMALRKLRLTLKLPPWLALPIAWVGSEYLRGVIITGFPWFFLGHSQATLLPMIQIADLVGAYGVSFVLAMTNGWIAQIVLRRWVQAKTFRGTAAIRRSASEAVLCALTVGATIAYGYWRLGQDTMRAGPPVAVIQEDYPMFVNGDNPNPWQVVESYLVLSTQAAKHKPALIVWPETSLPASINPEWLDRPLDPKLKDIDRLKIFQKFGRQMRKIITQHVRMTKAMMVIGALSKHPRSAEVYPQVESFNSAMVFRPDGSYGGRYDKIHLVLFGEFVPFRYSIPWLYRFLNENMTPYGRGGYEYSLTHGKQYTRFDLPYQGRRYRFATPICYEDAMAYVCRRFVKPQDGRKGVDFLVNISNDGWFGRSAELPQHLEICTFRAVENRVGIVRSVNTGVSAFISPAGKIEKLLQVNGRVRGPGVKGYLVGQVTLDSRISFYSRHGDWFAILCAGVVLVSAGSGPAGRLLRRLWAHDSRRKQAKVQ